MHLYLLAEGSLTHGLALAALIFLHNLELRAPEP